MVDIPAPQQGTTPTQPTEYEETPIIEPIKEEPAQVTPPSVPVQPVEPPPPPEPISSTPQKKVGVSLGVIILLVIIFIVAALVVTGGNFGSLLQLGKKQQPPAGAPAANLPTPTPVSPTANWLTYQVLSSTTKQPIPDVSFKLPPAVPAPICDGASCISQGTYLPGGTRFTVAARGVGQGLNYIRGAIITDAGGRQFVTKTATVSGVPAFAFSGTFTGSTVGGYTFSQMRGVMIELSRTTALEVNHFTPAGITTDFIADDALFDLILTTFTFPASAVPTPTPSSTPSPTPTLIPVATSSSKPATSSGY